MRLAVLSDIHGNLTALEAVLADLAAQGGADRTWVLGDLAAFGPRPVECIQRVQALQQAAIGDDESKRDLFRVIRGNTDRYLVSGARSSLKPPESAEEWDSFRANVRGRDDGLNWGAAQLGFAEFDYLRKLGGECDLHIPGFGHVIGYHGIPGDDEAMLTPETSDEAAADALMEREGRLGIGGHIHKQMDRVLEQSGSLGVVWRVINVGSVGLSFDAPGKAQYALFDFSDDGEITVDLRAVPYDVDAVLSDLRAVGYPAFDWTASKVRPA